MECVLNVNKSASINQGIVSQIVTYQIDVTNISKTTVENVVIKDLLCQDLKFIIGSVKVDYTPSVNSNIISGIDLDKLSPGEKKSITFDAEIVSVSQEYIENKCVCEYKYKIEDKYKYNFCYSNLNSILVKKPSLTLTKSASKRKVELNDIIDYSIQITNTGDLDAENIFLKVNIPPFIKLIEGSFTIDNVIVNSVEIEKGVMLNSLLKGENKLVKYKVKVVSSGCSGKIYSTANAIFSYTLPNKDILYSQSNDVSNCIEMSISSFKQITIEDYLTIPPHKPDMSEINDLKSEVKIDSINVIKTPIATSSGGQILSGYKLVVHGIINQVLEYASCEPTNSIHAYQYSIPFSNYIILPSDFNPENKVQVDSVVENIHYNVIDIRSFFNSITILLIAKIIEC